MSLSTDDPWTYETTDNMVICDQRGWEDATLEELTTLMEQFETLASEEGISASLTIMDPESSLDAETQEFLEGNTPIYDRLGIEKVALVSAGIQSLAIKSLVETPPGVEIDTFDERETAEAWCKSG
jgi:hypothetical protein